MRYIIIANNNIIDKKPEPEPESESEPESNESFLQEDIIDPAEEYNEK